MYSLSLKRVLFIGANLVESADALLEGASNSSDLAIA
jgi:hypothetical protein